MEIWLYVFCRLALLLGHRFVLKPQYDFAAGDSAQMWLRHNQVTTALKDDEVLTASFPFSMSGVLKLIVFLLEQCFALDSKCIFPGLYQVGSPWIIVGYVVCCIVSSTCALLSD